MSKNQMTANDFSFVENPRQRSEKRNASQRKIDFKEIYSDATSDHLSTQASRCLDCGNPYCEWKCPLHNYIPNWLSLVKESNFDSAATLMHETNPLPEICGRVCPQDRLCEKACTLETGFGAVTIGEIERSIADRALAKKWRPDVSHIEQSKKTVAIVGAGPAGLGCAELLTRNGVKVIVFDRYPEIGGLLTFGIPGFKLDKSIVRMRREFLEDIGVTFRLNTEIGTDVSIDELNNTFDAIFLGLGCYSPVDGRLKGLNAKGVIGSLDFLIANINQQENYKVANYLPKELREAIETPSHFDMRSKLDVQSKNVVVLGGGDTAMDCVRTAIRLGAASVKCVYRRGEADMPGSPQEVAHAKEEGVEFEFELQPTEIVVQDNCVKGVKVVSTKHANQESILKTNIKRSRIIDADIVIIAFGFRASPPAWLKSIGVVTHPNGLVKVRQGSQQCLTTNGALSKVFSGGDMVRGADLVVTAIAEGRKAASNILDFLHDKV